MGHEPFWYTDEQMNVYCASHALSAGITTRTKVSLLRALERWSGYTPFVCHSCDRRGQVRPPVQPVSQPTLGL